MASQEEGSKVEDREEGGEDCVLSTGELFLDVGSSTQAAIDFRYQVPLSFGRNACGGPQSLGL